MNMNITEFAYAVIKELSNLAPDITFTKVNTNKGNGANLTGIVFKGEGDAAPVFYINDYYEYYEDMGDAVPDDKIIEALSAVAKELFYQYEKLEIPQSVRDFAELLDFDFAKERLAFKVLEIERNEDMCKELPHFPLGCGLAGFPYIDLGSDDNGNTQSRVSWDLLDKWGVTIDELERVVLENVTKKRPNYMDMGDVLVVTNDDGFFGAGALFWPGVQEELSMKFGDYWVIPTSVHEVMVLKCVEERNVDDLKRMVYEGNRTITAETDVLSDNIYVYHDGRLEVA